MAVKTKSTIAESTIADLVRVPDKAELVHGELFHMSPTGGIPGRAGGRIYRSLAEYEERTGYGYAYPDNVGFIVNLPNRQSFSPDAAFYIGPDPGMKFPVGAPIFAAEVRSEGDYGPEAEREMGDKRADYFAAGTQIVWDVDLLNPDVIRSYCGNPDTPAAVFRRSDTANAEPALPAWVLPVNVLFTLPRHSTS